MAPTPFPQNLSSEGPSPESTSPDATEDHGPEDSHKSANGTPPSNIQKRRRITRACDECRRKKIKCDGTQPCLHCKVYSYDCTYDQPSNRRRNAAPQYIEALENQLKRAKALLNIMVPNLDLNDPAIDAHLQNGVIPQLPIASAPPRPAEPTARQFARPVDAGETADDSHLVSMVRATGQLDLDEEGNWDYHGHSSGLSFIKKMREQFGDVMPTQGGPFIKSRPMSQVFDSPKSTYDSTHNSPQNSSITLGGCDLPPKNEARVLCDNALTDASALLKIIHLPTFYSSMDRVYDTPPESYGNLENTFLPLLYSVLALGTLFSKNHSELDEIGYENAIDSGFKYFKASRQLMDIADCRDLVSLQAVVYMILFLQSSAKLSTCYAYIGVALRSALRMGLHRAFNDNFSPIEAESRKRLFWVIRKMDTYVGAILGLPHTLNDVDIDQEYPTELDDDYITESGLLPMPEGQISVIAGSNQHTRIVQILAKIVLHIYPIQGTHTTGAGNSVTYTVSYSKIREIEKDLQNWLDELPSGLKPGGEARQGIIRVQQLLRMAFAHAQMMLYRPFLHYVSQTCRSKGVDQRAFACASACVSVSRNIVHITAEMKRQGLLIGAHWFSMYTTFFAILSLVYFALENHENPTSNDILRDALEGKQVLAQLAKRSMAADRCTATLKVIFDQLPERLKRGREMAASKKRRQGTSHPSTAQADADSESDAKLPHQSTFPEPQSSRSKRASFPPTLPISQNQLLQLSADSPYHASPTQSHPDFFDSAPSLTPASSIMGFNAQSQSQHTPQQQAIQSFPATPVTNNFPDPSLPLADMSAMMFPSTDPFAYPNQPMTTFENTNFRFNPKDANSSPSMHSFSGFRPGSSSSQPAVFGDPSALSTGTMGSVKSPTNGQGTDSDVQLFGPMPMYLMQGAQHNPQMSLQSQNQDQAQGPGHNGLDMNGNGHFEGSTMNLDDLFSGDEWANTFLDQGLALGGFGGGSSGMGPWR
ncbi:uncharacterized protein BDZ99DRAFT_454211 [Mytilinidion resinicola]|uniref:Zn(2)-C6 fungal-type domain-containing protein n=1 Tax=Mytilinidion resinicola TaxID=574789 RepID=A0A6A6Y584_9PEZI|nr:uncharacterized protein BDZ99DRAFT_454211 [Mytilinidion resinicola]KAF2802947.1 hypothetical protein BDZ99DRAFT_454211 [Mytilinidion resinicola]